MTSKVHKGRSLDPGPTACYRRSWENPVIFPWPGQHASVLTSRHPFSQSSSRTPSCCLYFLVPFSSSFSFYPVLFSLFLFLLSSLLSLTGSVFSFTFPLSFLYLPPSAPFSPAPHFIPHSSPFIDQILIVYDRPAAVLDTGNTLVAREAPIPSWRWNLSQAFRGIRQVPPCILRGSLAALAAPAAGPGLWEFLQNVAMGCVECGSTAERDLRSEKPSTGI